jgi:hypothetical protein
MPVKYNALGTWYLRHSSIMSTIDFVVNFGWWHKNNKFIWMYFYCCSHVSQHLINQKSHLNCVVLHHSIDYIIQFVAMWGTTWFSYLKTPLHNQRILHVSSLPILFRSSFSHANLSYPFTPLADDNTVITNFTWWTLLIFPLFWLTPHRAYFGRYHNRPLEVTTIEIKTTIFFSTIWSNFCFDHLEFKVLTLKLKV